MTKRTIGILGGSFNPAHSGHTRVSIEAMRQLGLDEVWWLVSPQNPLKPKDGMADFETRFASAMAEATHPKILVSAFEQQIGSQFTADTLAALTRLYPKYRFIWLMGADNLCQFHRWRDWQKIFQTVPIAVYERWPYSIKTPQSKAATRYQKFIQPIDKLKYSQAPAWCFLRGRRSPLSSTNLRNSLGENAFLGHNKNADNA